MQLCLMCASIGSMHSSALCIAITQLKSTIIVISAKNCRPKDVINMFSFEPMARVTGMGFKSFGQNN